MKIHLMKSSQSNHVSHGHSHLLLVHRLRRLRGTSGSVLGQRITYSLSNSGRMNPVQRVSAVIYTNNTIRDL